MYVRSKKNVLSVFFKKQFYVAFVNIFRYFLEPFDVLLRYVFRKGSYPKDCFVKTPTGIQKVSLYCSDDMMTFVECFGKLDYRVPTDISCVVDFGSNIGISALYFLTRNPKVHIYLYEPLPANIDKLKKNLRGYENRYELNAVAVGLENGTGLFSHEPTGRYGGLYKSTMKSQIEVPVQCAKEIVRDILKKHQKIDILKIDVEGLENDIINDLEIDLFDGIDRIYAETHFEGELPGFKKEQYGEIVRFYK
ncbi:MAG: FkbM family methyltransferase [Nitrospinaceae bacterium]